MCGRENRDVTLTWRFLKYWRPDPLFNSLIRLPMNIITKLRISDPLWGVSTSERWILLTKDPGMQTPT